MKRTLILAAVLGAGFSSVFLLPPFKVAPSAMSMEIPKKIGAWETALVDPTDKERTSLASDTLFSKARCGLARPGTWSAANSPIWDVADLSIVLSGQDLANSIHRPERCMEAQGHAIYDRQKVMVEVPGNRELPTKRLLSKVKVGENKDDLYDMRFITYYFFVGKEQITEDHQTRVLADMKNRLENGEAQRWAYVLVSLPYRDKEDTDPRLADKPSLESADLKVRELLGDIAASNITWERVKTIR